MGHYKGEDAPGVWETELASSRDMELVWANFRFLCGLHGTTVVAAGTGRATAYLIDPVREQLIALKQWEMPSMLPPSLFLPTLLLYSIPS